MKDYNTDKIRNVALLGHLGCGKTSLGEALLYAAGAIGKKGEVEKKNTVGDFTPEEQSRLTSLSSALLPLEWKEYKYNFLDTPGSEEFIGQIENVLAVSDAAVIVIDAAKGVEIGTERVWSEVRKRNMPTIIFIDKMDKENVKLNDVVSEIHRTMSKNAVRFSLEIGGTNDYRGYADILAKKAYYLDGTEGEIPGELETQSELIYAELTEQAASASEDLMMKYFDTMELSKEEVITGLKIGVHNSEMFPVLIGSGLKDSGVTSLLDMIADFFPAPNQTAPKKILKGGRESEREVTVDAPFAAYVFKTIIDPFQGSVSFFKVMSGSVRAGQEIINSVTGNTLKMTAVFTMMGKTQIPVGTLVAGDIGCVAKLTELTNGATISEKKDPVVYPPVVHPTPVIYIAVIPKNKQDEDKVSISLQKLRSEDETLEIVRNQETSQLLIGGQGMTHLGYVIEKMKNMFKVEVLTADQRVVYRETITTKGEAQGKHKKQSGGAGQYGDVWIRFEPCQEKFIFAEEVVGGSVPKNFFPAVEKGLIETLERGPLAGFPVIGVKATLYFGSYHEVDSNEISFKLAARLAFLNAVPKIKPTILEPIYQVNIVIKDEYVGTVMGDMSKRRGRVIGTNALIGAQEIIAEVPEAEIVKYAIDLKAMTQASGHFSRKFLRYEAVPEFLIGKIVEETKRYEQK